MILRDRFDFLPEARHCSDGMKSFWTWFLGFCAICGVMFVTMSASAATTWSYFPTNAFPSLIFSNPVCITSPPGETNRLFIVEKHGRIIVITNLMNPTRTVFMDISSRMSVDTSSESGDVSGE
jgi:hypothetical protein